MSVEYCCDWVVHQFYEQVKGVMKQMTFQIEVTVFSSGLW